MFEFDQASPSAAPAATPALSYRHVSEIAEMSLLVWGEHCIECAAPACFTSCDLYSSRPDMRCRRFQVGAVRNPAFPSFRGYGVEIEFKRWGKVEARGNTRMFPAGRVRAFEAMLAATAPAINTAGKLGYAITRDQRFRWINHALRERLGRWLHREGAEQNPPEMFLLEVYNPSPAPLQLNVTITSAARPVRIGSMYRSTLVFPQGYSRHEIDYRLFQKVVQEGSFDISLTPAADSGGRLVFLTADFVRLAKSASTAQRESIKCVVWDLDNTVWKGVLLEGVEPLLRSEVERLFQFFDERGILQSIASKNDEASALAALERLGIADYFLYPQINWNPKSENLRRIAKSLNIGINTFAFIDDNPFEREEVAAALPDVLCIDAAEIASLTADPRFQGSTSAEARTRRSLYKDAIKREEDERLYDNDYLGFLRTCGIRFEIAAYTTDDLERAAELVQRTNQLNFSGRKYGRSQFLEIADDPSIAKYVLRCSDKYGSYGTIGFAMVRSFDEELYVEDFMLSCRVQGKFLEQAFFAHLLAEHNDRRAGVLRVNYTATAKNTPARKVLESIGFVQGMGNGMQLSAGAPLACDFISLACSCPHADAAPLLPPDGQ